MNKPLYIFIKHTLNNFIILHFSLLQTKILLKIKYKIFYLYSIKKRKLKICLFDKILSIQNSAQKYFQIEKKTYRNSRTDSGQFFC